MSPIYSDSHSHSPRSPFSPAFSPAFYPTEEETIIALLKKIITEAKLGHKEEVKKASELPIIMNSMALQNDVTEVLRETKKGDLKTVIERANLLLKNLQRSPPPATSPFRSIVRWNSFEGVEEN